VDSVNLEDLYYRAWQTPGNINEHLPTLRALASDCESVVEFGTNQAVSTTAFLSAQPARLRTVDINPSPEAESLRQHAGKTVYDVVQGDSRYVEIGPVDLLFIDSLHTREQLAVELATHAKHVRRWIILHDTVTFGDRGEDGGQGLLPAVREFLGDRPEWRLSAEWRHNNGLMLLSRHSA
jgi:predicted O-methyltransferase YrrM